MTFCANNNNLEMKTKTIFVENKSNKDEFIRVIKCFNFDVAFKMFNEFQFPSINYNFPFQ